VSTGFDRRLYAPMVLGSVLNPINSSMMAVALVPIGIAFGAPATETAWLVSGLYLATAIGQPVTGRLVDLFGPRRVFLAGAVFTAVAGAVGALAPTLAVLVLARVFLGLGTCAGYPTAMNLIQREGVRTGVPSPAVPLAVLAVANQTIALVGPTLGGLLLGWGDWRWIFLVNLPLALASALLGWFVLPRDEPRRRTERLGLDLPGMALFAVTLLGLLLFWMAPSLEDWWLLAIAAVAGVSFWVWERRAERPFIEVRVLVGNRPLVATYLRMLLAAISAYMFLYGVTQWLQTGFGLTPVQAGLLLLPTIGVAIVVTSLTGRSPRVRGKLLVAALCQVLAAALLLGVGSSSPVWLLAVIAGVIGIPQGLANLANQNALYHQADPERVASSAGLLRTFMYLGAIVASAANGLAFAHGADTGGLRELATIMLVAALLFAALVVLDRSLGAIGRQDGPSRLLVLLAPLLGRLLRNRHAGLEHSVRTAPELQAQAMITLTSTSFAAGGEIPDRCCALGLGEDRSPQLAWQGVPGGTAQLLLVVEDVDAPLRRPSIHLAALFGADVTGFAEGALVPDAPGVRYLPDRRGRLGYHGPMPPPHHGPHRYGFHLYALAEAVPVQREFGSLAELVPHLAGHVLASGFLEGWYETSRIAVAGSRRVRSGQSI